MIGLLGGQAGRVSANTPEPAFLPRGHVALPGTRKPFHNLNAKGAMPAMAQPPNFCGRSCATRPASRRAHRSGILARRKHRVWDYITDRGLSAIEKEIATVQIGMARR